MGGPMTPPPVLCYVPQSRVRVRRLRGEDCESADFLLIQVQERRRGPLGRSPSNQVGKVTFHPLFVGSSSVLFVFPATGLCGPRLLFAGRVSVYTACEPCYMTS